MLRGIACAVALLLAAFCTGCGGLPVAGPLRSEVIDNAGSSRPTDIAYTVIDVTPVVCETLGMQTPRSFLTVFGQAAPKPNYVIAPGDTLAVTIWEAGNNGLFSNATPLSGVSLPRGATLPLLTVAQDGKITVPYAGRIAVSEKTTTQAEHLIAAGLAGKVSDPQVVVSVTRSETNAVIVGGEVAKGSRVILGVDGERILDAIADAGGVRIPINESQIRLTRGTQTASLFYNALFEHPEENIYLQPGDIVTVTRAPKTFTAFGALGRNYQIAFETDELSAEEAIAKTGGFLDTRADPSGVFVFRFETAALVEALAPGSHPITTKNGVPVVYRIDMSQADGYFLARQFAIHDKDIVYAANARLNEVQKFLSLLGSVLTPAATGAAVSTAVH